MKLWGLRVCGGKLDPISMRTRREIQVWAAQRYMGADDYRNILQNSYRPISALWRKVRKNHPEFRIVRVTVSEREPNE